jgi:hypothetical protein
MKFVKTLLIFVGILTLVFIGLVTAKLLPILAEFDPQFVNVYRDFAYKLIETQDPGAAMVKAIPVQDGISTDDVIQSMKSLAVSRDFLFVGESPFYKQVEAVTGTPYRYVNFLSFCDARIGKMMADYRDLYTAFMPCRIALVEDKNGKLWLYSMNLELMIYGGKTLPPELKQGALKVWDTIQYIMDNAAKGEF